jgi:hypothetical protein
MEKREEFVDYIGGIEIFNWQKFQSVFITRVKLVLNKKLH